jgi:hypothetical protein
VRSQPPPDCVLSPMGLPLRQVRTFSCYFFVDHYFTVHDSFISCFIVFVCLFL